MPSSGYSFTEERFALCEGDDDKFFLEALIKERRLPKFQVKHTGECSGHGGTSGFLHALNGIELLGGFAQVKGILLLTDNDKIPKSFNDMRRILRALKISVPDEPSEILTICGKPAALLLVPDHKTVGDLETLSWPAIVDKWPNVARCVPEFLRCTGADQWRRPSSINKATLRSAIISNYADDPYKTLGLLFKKGVISTTHKCFDAVAQFLTDFDRMVGI